jgi:hypothetical protein
MTLKVGTGWFFRNVGDNTNLICVKFQQSADIFYLHGAEFLLNDSYSADHEVYRVCTNRVFITVFTTACLLSLK